MLAAMAPALTALTLASSSALGPRPAACLASLTALRELAVLDDDGCGGLGPEEAASIAGLRHLRQLPPPSPQPPSRTRAFLPETI